jgi:Ca-activated chloride channel family protein
VKQGTAVFFIVLLGLLTGCTGSGVQPTATGSAGACAPNAIEISIIYAPESRQYLPQIMASFNSAYAAGRNPVTGQPLATGERPICITGQDGSSGTVMQGIVNAIIAPNNANVARPTIFQPSVSHWLALANFQSGRPLFDLTASRATALAPVVMAIWESRLEAIRRTVGYDEIGWEELLGVLNSPNGWCDYGIPPGECRRTVYYGHTDPLVSSTALSTLIAEFYASARQAGYTDRRLTLQMVRDEAVQDGVRRIEELIRHYSTRTTEFREYIAQGPNYLDFVALEENDLIYINRGLTQYGAPPERLVALYPKEGTFWHEHPMGIVNADWTTPEQRAAASVFVDYVLLPDNQRLIMEQAFRPANPDVPLDFPFVEENGVDPDQPTAVLDIPAPEVIAAVQQSWAFVKKQADVLLVIDISGSMQNEDKIGQARAAAEAFLNAMEATNRIGLMTFSNQINLVVPLNTVETNQVAMYSNIRSLRAEGGTELYQALTRAVEYMNGQPDENRIRAIVLLSDGADTGDQGYTLNDAVVAIEASRDALNPVIVIPVAYGSDADVNALNAIARASNTRVQSGSAGDILRVLEIISSYF